MLCRGASNLESSGLLALLWASLQHTPKEKGWLIGCVEGWGHLNEVISLGGAVTFPITRIPNYVNVAITISPLLQSLAYSACQKYDTTLYNITKPGTYTSYTLTMTWVDPYPRGGYVMTASWTYYYYENRSYGALYDCFGGGKEVR